MLFFWILPTMRRFCYLSLVWTPALLWRSPSTVVFGLQWSGPVFIKLGQWLSTRRDIIPSNICDAMGELHEHVPASGAKRDVRHAVTQIPQLELGSLMGGGCVAQVYHGKFQGQEVAVKVRRSGIMKRLEMDLKLLHKAAWIIEHLRPQLLWMALNEALENFAFYMKQQVNLSQEAVYMKRFDANFKARKNIIVPQIYAHTESVLVMEVAAGDSLSNFIKQNHSKEKRLEVHGVLTDMMAKMALQDGFLHGDLHPGNLFIQLQGAQQKPLVTLIDTGISIQMTKQLRDFTKEAMGAAFRKDAFKLGSAVVKLHEKENLTNYAENVEQLKDDMGNLLLAGCFMVGEEIWSKRFATFEDYNGTKVSQYFDFLMSDLSSHKIRVAPDLWSIMTAFALIEGSISELGFGVNVLGSCVPYLMNHFNPLDWIRRKQTLAESDKNSEAAGRK